MVLRFRVPVLRVVARRLTRRLRPAAEALSRACDRFIGSVPAWYPALFVVATVAVLAAWPIVRTDTDLWYHLNTGRWILEHRALPADSSYFSFLSPPRLYRDYFWLFQVLVYAAFKGGGYLGLVLLRAGLAGLLAAAIAAFVFTGKQRGGWQVAVLVAVLSSIMPRVMAVRPHLVEYFCIVAFLFVLDRKPSWAFVLPLLAVAWGNLHGVSYPILLAICGAYILERYVSPRSSALDERAMAFAAVAMAAIFATPLGHRLVDMPFIMDDRQHFLVRELRRLSLRDILSFHIDTGALDPPTWFNVILGAGLLSAVGAAFSGTVRLPHLLLFGVGVLLLPRGLRFQYEMALLSLPMLCEPPLEPLRARWQTSRALAVAALLAAPFVPLYFLAAGRPPYPVFEQSLPRGVSTFLMREGGGGKLLNRSDVGGYYGWRLASKYQIAIDMQPFPDFADYVFLQSRWYRDPEALRPMINQYRPEFIAAARLGASFRDVIKKFPDYVPVFFDDEDVLFASRAQRPELVRKWRLPVDPFEIETLEPDKLADPKGRKGCRPLYLARMLEIDPDNLLALISAGRACLKQGDAAAAEAHARAVIRSYPRNWIGYNLLGSSLERAGRWWEAIEAYRRQLESTRDTRPVHARLANVYDRLGLRDEAEREALLAAPELDPAVVIETLGSAQKRKNGRSSPANRPGVK